MNMNWQASKTESIEPGTKSIATVCLNSCHKLLKQVHNVKNSLLSKYGVALDGREQILHSALTEAEALAWQTPFPHLFFPVLAEEKVSAARRWAARQEVVGRADWTKVMAA